jgi:hypothetical protein
MFPVLPGEGMFTQDPDSPFGSYPLASFPVVQEKPFPCTRDRRLVAGDPGMPYTLHSCWQGPPCMEWRFQIAERMTATERTVARIARENATSIRTFVRGPGGFVSTSYDFRPEKKPVVGEMRIAVWMVAAILMIILLASI